MWLRKKKLKSLIGFLSANKINNYNREGKMGEKRKPIWKNLQKSKHRNNKCFSWVTAVRVLSLAGSHSLPHLPKMPSTPCWSLDLLWGPLRFYSGPSPVCSCLQCPQLSELVCFHLWELSMPFIHSIGRVCLVDHVDLISSLYGWWDGFGFSSLATLLLGFNCGFISTSASGSSTGVCSWGCPGGLGFATVRARCGGGAAA